VRAVTTTLIFIAVAAALTGCSRGGGSPARVLRMEIANPAGAAHDPGAAFFAAKVAALSHGRLRIAYDDRWGREGEALETGLIRDVKAGRAELGVAHTRFLVRAGARRFDALDAPTLVDRYSLQAAVITGPLGRRMLADTRAVGVEGLALLAGRLAYLIGTRGPIRSVRDVAGREIALRAWRPNEHYLPGSPLPALTLHAIGAYPRPLSNERIFAIYVTAEGSPERPSIYEDDLDSLFFDRYGGRCARPDPACRTLGPWITVDVALWPRTAVIVANAAALARLTPRERGWVRTAAAAAHRRSLSVAGGDQRLLAELCAAGARAVSAPARAVADLRRTLRAAYARLGDRQLIGALERLRSRTAPDPPLRIPPGCGRHHAHEGPARGVRSPLPGGVYRVQITSDDLRAAGAKEIGDRTGVATLTLRDGLWRLRWTEPPGPGTGGTYAGTPLRTAWMFGTGRSRDEAYMSIVTGPGGGLRFSVGHASDLPHLEALFASHPWRRIGS
jgi:TRAP-type C4-dicarboxylate transport system substrate-binding protein